MYRIFFITFVLFIVSCSPQQRLRNSFMGKNVSELQKELGTPLIIINKAGEKVYVYEKKKELRGTEIGQAKVTLDPIVSPRVIKTERFLIHVKNEIVTKITRENEYERKK